MKLFLVLGACFPQENVALTPSIDPAALQRALGDSAPAQDQPQAAAPKATPWDGTFAEGMAEVVRLAASDDVQAALEITDRLLVRNGYQQWRENWLEDGGLYARAALAVDRPMTWLGYEHLDPGSRAEVRFAQGLLYAKQSAVLDADKQFELARADAGPGELRQGSVFALGLLDLRTAEELYEKIPEVQGAPPQVPPPPGSPQATDAEPDTLPLARQAFMDARAHLVERAQLDWQHAPTRAALELCVRRLRELDDIERRREEEQQKQEEQQSEEQQENPGDQEQDPQDQQEQAAPSEEESEGEPQDQDEPEEQQVPEEPAEADAEPQPSEPEERVLTEEQMKQLMQLLREHSEAGEELKARFQDRGRGRVERDW